MPSWLRLIDGNLANNPIYTIELRHFPKHSRHYLLSLPLVLFALVVGSAMISVAIFDHQNTYFVLAFGGSILLDLILDFACLMASTRRIHGDIRWDLLRVTMLSERDIVMGKHAVVQLYAWRVARVVFGIRIGLALASVVPLAMISASLGEISVLDLAMFWLTVPLFLFVYIAEPIWRMRAMTALMMAFSMRFNTTWLILRGFATIFGVWLSQVMIVFLLAVFSWSMVGIFLVMPGMGLFVMCVIFAGVILIYYVTIRETNLDAAKSRVLA